MPSARRALGRLATTCALLALPLAGAAAPAVASARPATPAAAPASASASESAVPQLLAATPPMGWNDWAHYQCGISESTITANADALVSSGLAAKGYTTVTVDDCWMSSSRDSAGNLVADPAEFPHGMAWLGSYLHSRGLKFGIYEDAGSSTCGGYPGSGLPQGGGADHFAQDAASFASWGVDYLKLDGCNVWTAPGQTQEQAYRQAYDAQAAALRGSGRAITFSESAPAYFQSGEWGNPSWFSVLGWVGQDGQLWREGYDIATYDASNPSASRWSSVLSNYGYNRWIGRYAKPGNWNDPDFLIAGDGGLSDDESRSQVALWSMMAAPMILSSDVAHLTPAALAALGNTDLVALDQDSAGEQAAVVSTNGSTDVLARPLANGDRAVAVLNRTGSARSISTALASVGLPGCTVSAKNLWTGASSTTSSNLTATVPAHGTAIWRLTPQGCAAPVPTGQLTGNGAKCVDDSNSSTTNGNPVILYGCTGNANQRWTLNSDGTVRTLGNCLTAAGGSAGAAVTLNDCGASGQQWTANGDGTLTAAGSGLCLDVTGGGTADGTELDVWTCGDHQANQAWSLPV
ncbi:ricin-type beta-trefoil lectin domain protein [Kitasatospora sp. NBC_01287]|uniref:ricin-type beta-trefoil lectin domain protein n=1 Tax=Kitasatospora sp. NBC_01287 TaxID=2903573 RepID=UPI00224DDDB7|nr:ricin-type beta-trefoil lectin domain protein [Kitasatospora sp. NBC_01287]MCX4746827.1 ricin-type beta-trefoil lectin domain protein [Kitasatospora sp. NBC_01287]